MERGGRAEGGGSMKRAKRRENEVPGAGKGLIGPKQASGKAGFGKRVEKELGLQVPISPHADSSTCARNTIRNP
jgi:hypothetical protein